MLFSIGILAVSLSLDALGVGVAYGLRKVRIPLASKLTICFFSILYAAIALLAGSSLSRLFNPFTSKLIGIGILLLMGTWIIAQNLLKKEPGGTKEDIVPEKRTVFQLVIKSFGITIQVIKNPVRGDIDSSGTIDFREALLLGLALSIDAIGVGIGSALAGFRSMYIPFAIGAFQLFFLYAGSYIGGKMVLFDRLNKKAFALLPGILLILLALLRMY